MNKKDFILATKENSEKALNLLETKGHTHLRSFIEFINKSDSINAPLGTSNECLSLEMARQYIEHTIMDKTEKIPLSIRTHIKSCNFCNNFVSKIPKPEMTENIWKIIKKKIKREGIRANVVHTKKVNQYENILSIGFPKGQRTKVSDIQLNTLQIINKKRAIKRRAIKRTAYRTCRTDRRKELDVIINRKIVKDKEIGIIGFLKNKTRFSTSIEPNI